MQRLSGMDAAFLNMETPAQHMHVSGIMFLDPSTTEKGFSFERLAETVEARMHLIPQFRRKVLRVPFDLDDPVWVDDPDFDISSHLFHVALPEGSSRRHLADRVGEILSRPMERDRPLWRMWYFEGLEDGTIGLLSMMHHSEVDGITGSELMASLFDTEPDADQPEPPSVPWQPERTPYKLELAASAAADWIRHPLRRASAVSRIGSSVFNMGRGIVGIGRDRFDAPLPFTAPRTPFNGTLTGERVVAFSQAGLDDLKLVKTVFGTKVNDVVLTACAVSLRSFLRSWGGVPDKPLLVAVPVSVHSQASERSGVNQVSNMFVRLPLEPDDPVDLLKAIHAGSIDSKAAHDAMGPDMIQDLAQIAPPRLFRFLTRATAFMRIPDLMPPVLNTIISNVPGPPMPLYIAGARVLAIYPFGPLIESVGLNLTVISNMGNVDFGVLSCGDMIADPWPIADGWASAVDDLAKAARERGDTGIESS